MNILVACKIIPDDQDAQVVDGGALDFSRAHAVVSEYDLNAIEFAARLDGSGESSVKAISVGGSLANDSKVKKGILARGVDELLMISDDACADLDSAATAVELGRLAVESGEFDLIIVGAGSADLYAKQVGVHLAARLEVPYVSGVVEAHVEGGCLACTRVLEDAVESVEVSMPCVLSVLPDAAQPRIPGMKDILAAGKKPMREFEYTGVSAPAVSTVSITAPVQADRKLEIFDDIDAFVAAVAAVI